MRGELTGQFVSTGKLAGKSAGNRKAMWQLRHMDDRLKTQIVSMARDRRWTQSVCRLAARAAPLVLTGCSHSPEYSIFGSFFPAWIFCSIAGLLLMAGARAAIARTVVGAQLAAPVLFYLSMAVFLTCMLWLLIYS